MTSTEMQRALLDISERYRMLANVARHQGRDALADELCNLGMLTASVVGRVTNGVKQ